jgi:hypothetical protein
VRLKLARAGVLEQIGAANILDTLELALAHAPVAAQAPTES